MARFVSRFVFSIGTLLLAACLAAGQALPRQCGYDRWPVKILTDKDRERVDFSPLEGTVAQLVAIPIHEIPYPRDRRIGPEELRVYRLRARLLKTQHEQDSDLHLIVADLDKPDVQMIVEIPAPACGEGSGYEQKYRKARDVISSVHIGDVIEITGVGFFDFIHTAEGAAKNGFELHPVLKIQRVP